MKIKKYALHGLIVFVSFIILSYLSFFFKVLMSHSSISGLSAGLLNTLIPPIFYIIMGVIIGLENFFNEHRKIGKWKADKLRLVFLGLPSAYLTFYSFIYFFIKIPLLPLNLSLNIMHNGFNLMVGVVFGYFLINSFYKEHMN